ncbi:MAG: RAMP superfamily CRISPR-associated protein, partial [Clostridia bacterium]|nr:RAMP superfamily CRISPR-associated protein [Clostridia bacterium]
MKTGWLEVELRSEMCPATGEGVAGIVDTEIAHEYGLPIIPAKRIKGCLLEVAKELLDCDVVGMKEVCLLFGASGQGNSGMLHVQDLHIYKVPNFLGIKGDTSEFITVEDYDDLVQRLKNQNKILPAEVLDELTFLRTRTAIEGESKTAKKTSLRTLRVMKKGIVLRCKVSIDTYLKEDKKKDKKEKKIERLLKDCVKGLRHMGLGKTRGLGEVRCRLGKMSEPDTSCSEQFDIPYKEKEEVELRYQVHLDNPLIFPGENGLYNTCENWIPGSAMLGALAGMYIAKHELKKNAHQDKDFAEIFLRDGVKFGYAFPMVNGQVFYPCPATWQRVKHEDRYYDLADEILKQKGSVSQQEDKTIHQQEQRCSVKKLVCREEEGLCLHEPAKQLRTHHARPVDRGIGHAWKDEEQRKGTGDTGQLFQYLSLCAGQTFAGTLRGEARHIKALLECLQERNNRLRLGRSRTAEYGDVTFKPQEVTVASVSDKENIRPKTSLKKFTLWLISPMMLCDEDTGRIVQDPQIFLNEIENCLKCEVKQVHPFLKFTQLAGYNSKWRLPKPQRQVLAGGTALVIETKEPVRSADIEGRLWGMNTGEGCGEVKVIEYKESSEEPVGGEAGYFKEKPKESCKQPHDLEKKGNEKRDKREERDEDCLLNVLQKKKMEKEKEQEEIQKMKREQQKRQEFLGENEEKLNPTKIHQIIALFEKYQEYERVKQELEKIKDDKKKKQCIKFIKPCERQSIACIKAYLQIAK